MKKSTSVVSANIDRQLLTINVDGAGTIAVDLEELGGEIVRFAAMHGLKQKICDAAAIPRDLETGKSATPQQKYEAMLRVVETLRRGEWNAARGEGGGVKGGLLFRALCRMQPSKTPEEIRAFLDKRTKEEQAALRKNARVAAIIAELQAESAKSVDVDTDELLSELE